MSLKHNNKKKILIQITFSHFFFATDTEPLTKNNQYHVVFMLRYRNMTEKCLKNIFFNHNLLI